MRAPGEATGHMALEIAMDEMAERLGMDPVALRILNDTQVVPDHSPPPSVATIHRARRPSRRRTSRSLPGSRSHSANWFAAFKWARSASAWNRRHARPGQVKDGPWLVGMGVAAAYRGAPVMKSAARVRLDARGMVTVETDMTDIGTGSYTILAQTAAEMLGVPLKLVVVRLGDSNFPVSSGLGRTVGVPRVPPPGLYGRVQQAAGGGGTEAGIRSRTGALRARHGARCRAQRAAGASRVVAGGGRRRHHGVRGPRQEDAAIDLRCALCRSRCGCLHR